eukprot:TRINITY_DN2793_c0_g1_i1.p1 TRINITY_DN2793_c0_g1~~TRINITY_DN2793_c0_g1_i1.p1  ORF type:complete len:433 (+),score=114.65 TRINITY_DN2793_c0_g1_i1:186-1301(+)
MGWNSWNHFGCITDCATHPNECISENLFKTMADAMSSSGLSQVGYEYINIDDCWLANTRDANGRLQPDPKRFPSGMKALGDYIHSKGLKFGIYGDWGTNTCEGYPGTKGFEAVDAKTFAEWGVDFVKLDGCNANVSDMKAGYTLMSHALNATGRPMVFSCSWPAYYNTDNTSTNFNYTYIGTICNLWRLWDDIRDNFQSILGIMEYWGTHTELQPAAAPGQWNDPDMLEIGNGAETDGEYRIHLSVWSIIAAPLIAGNDLRNMTQATFEILTNTEVIAVDQDPAGIQGKRIKYNQMSQVWVRKLGDGSLAVALVNTNTIAFQLTVTWADLGISGNWNARDLWKHKNLGGFDQQFSSLVPPHDVAMVKLTRA